MRIAHRWLVAAATTLLSATTAACKDSGAEGGPGGPGGPGGGGPPPATPVGAVAVETKKITLTTDLPGRTSASLVAEIRPQIGGLLVKRSFVEGADVTAGDVLYEIDPAPYEVSKTQAEAALRRAEAALATARARTKRLDALVGSDIIAKQERDDAAGLANQAAAEVAAAKAAVDRTKVDLGYATVTAPISGRIGRSMVTQGALVAPYQGVPLATIQQLDPIYIDIAQSTVDMLRLRKAISSGTVAAKTEAKIELVLEDGSHYEHKGTLQFADAAVDPATGSITLRAVVPNPDKTLLPGMFVRAIVEEGDTANALLVPQQGVTRDAKGLPTALVAVCQPSPTPPKPNEPPNCTAELRVLEVDRTVGDQWLVTKGIKPGEQVIVEGLQKVRPGAPVIPMPPSWMQPPAGPGGAPGGPGGGPGGAPGGGGGGGGGEAPKAGER